MTQNKRIAVTGGIGSGKSTVCALLRQKGFPVYSCDEINRSLWDDAEYLSELARLFPHCTVNGKIDKQRLSKFVFSDREGLQRLNGIAHPKIIGRLKQAMQVEDGIVFAEVPLLFEGGYRDLFDAVLVVTRDEEKRINSVAARDGLTRGQVLARIDNQYGYRDELDRNCYLLDNNGNLTELEPKLDGLLATICGRK